ncbi:MAG: hypothetical protein VYA84_07900 [Planctomycetota bacterium]|nr:hypothetical protein [Planctomycetota bacterium]
MNTAPGYGVHRDSYNQIDVLLGPADSKHTKVIDCEGRKLQAIRCGDLKAQSIVKNKGWFGAKEHRNALFLFYLCRDRCKRVAEGSGNIFELLR